MTGSMTGPSAKYSYMGFLPISSWRGWAGWQRSSGSQSVFLPIGDIHRSLLSFMEPALRFFRDADGGGELRPDR
jgi:hypothetical protein